MIKYKKLRIVWNASKRFEGICLNDELEKGPNLMNSLFKVLIRWRLNKIALVGDIKKMFTQIVICERDRPFLSFFWQSSEEQESQIYEWTRLIFGSKPSPDLSFSSIIYLAEQNKFDFPKGSNALKNDIFHIFLLAIYLTFSEN